MAKQAPTYIFIDETLLMHQLKDSSYISEMRPENAVTRKIDKKMSVDLRHHVPHLREKKIKIKP